MRQRLRTSLRKRLGSFGTMPVMRVRAVMALVCVFLTVGATGESSSQSAGSQKNMTLKLKSETKQAPQGWVGLYITCEPGQYPVLISVEPGSPAQAAGLTAGDTVLSSNGVSTLGKARFLEPFKPGDRFTLKLRKNGVRSATVVVGHRVNAMQLSFKLGDGVLELPINISDFLNAAMAAEPIQFQSRMIFLGAELSDLNEGLASALHVKASGVLVLQVSPISPAQTSGLQGGDVIIKVDTTPVASSRTILESVQKAEKVQKAPDRSLKLEILRAGKQETRTVRW